MNGLSLCSGIGGIDLGLHLAVPGYRTVCYVEKEAYCQEVLCARMADGWLDRGPIWDDVATFAAHEWKGCVDVVHGGYPCQPFSGLNRFPASSQNLWPHVARVVAECRPAYCFFENVRDHLSKGFIRVASDLESLGYCVSAGIFRAAELGAPHLRPRLYILAHSNGQRLQASLPPRDPGARTPWGKTMELAGASNKDRGTWDPTEPNVPRVADGLPHRVDRLKALGNAVVPAVAALAWRTLYGELNG